MRMRIRIEQGCRQECEPLIRLIVQIKAMHAKPTIIFCGKTGSFDIIEEMPPAAKLMLDRVQAQINAILDKYRAIAAREFPGEPQEQQATIL